MVGIVLCVVRTRMWCSSDVWLRVRCSVRVMCGWDCAMCGQDQDVVFWMLCSWDANAAFEGAITYLPTLKNHW